MKDHEIIFKLIAYFVGDKMNAEKLGLDLQKGILLIGFAREPHVFCSSTQAQSHHEIVT